MPTTGNYTVQWDAAPNAVRYRIELWNGSTWQEKQNASAVVYSVSGQSPGSYRYRVRACRSVTDVAYCGEYTPELTVDVDAAPPAIPHAPGLVYVHYPVSGASKSTDGNYTVTWALSGGATSYMLQEKYRYGASEEYGDTSWHDLTLPAGAEQWAPNPPKSGYGHYYYRVRACNVTGCSAFTTQNIKAKVYLPNVLPAQPAITSITDNPSTTGIYTVAWSAAARADQYRLEENPDRVNWNEVAVQAGRSWTTPQARPNGMYTYRVRGCNAYGCGETSLLLAPASVAVAIPATLPMTPPQAFAVAPDTIAPNLPVRFYWQAVPGAESYLLVAKDVACHASGLIEVGVPANTAMPYRQPSFIPRCNNQVQDQVTLRYWVKACTAGVCSESSNTQDLYVGIEPRSVETVSETTYIHTDALRSPVAETDASGAVVKRMAYTPWGVPADGIYTQGSGYTGHVTDAATGLSYMQQRYYDPVGARFVSPDPVRPDAESGANFNRYWYANNNPYKYVDPDGRMPECAPHCTLEEADAYVASQARALVGVWAGTAVIGASSAVLAATGMSAGTVATVKLAWRYAKSDEGRAIACLTFSLACKDPATIKPGDCQSREARSGIPGSSRSGAAQRNESWA